MNYIMSYNWIKYNVILERGAINSGDWNPIFPVDLIFDSKEESFLLKILCVSSEEHTVVINAIDAEGNVGSSRIVFNP
jgi:hypothetical protein